MRTINYYSEKPKQKERVVIGNRAVIFIRRNITDESYTDEEGNTVALWSAIEYTTKVNANFKDWQSAEFAQKVIDIDTEAEAKKVREKRNELLDETDKELMADRGHTEEELEAWKAYRQALRDIPKQKGFPWEVEFPQKP